MYEYVCACVLLAICVKVCLYAYFERRMSIIHFSHPLLKNFLSLNSGGTCAKSCDVRTHREAKIRAKDDGPASSSLLALCGAHGERLLACLSDNCDYHWRVVPV